MNKTNTTGIIVQARTGSTRMPGKVVKPFFQNNSILDIILSTLKNLPFKVILATSENPENDILKTVAENNQVEFFQGSENDVLKRFIDCGEHFKLTDIFRVCADNPFLSTELMMQLWELKQKNPEADYVSFTFNSKPVIQTHFGFFAELTTLKSLRKVSRLTDDMFYHEHVTNFIYQNPGIFKLVLKELDKGIFSSGDIRLTIDTPDDFKLAQKLYAYLKEGNKDFDYEEVIQSVLSEDDYLREMKKQIERNQK